MTSLAFAIADCCRRLERALQTLGAQLEVGLLVEHFLQQRFDRGAHARSSLGARGLAADARQIAVEPLEALQQFGRLGVAGQAFERRLALADELAGQRPVAVQRRGGRPTPASRLRAELERHLGARGDLGAQMGAGRPQELRERCLELS